MVETKSVAFVVSYDKSGNPIAINPALHADFVKNLKK